jgi:FkbM family methyltransferase
LRDVFEYLRAFGYLVFKMEAQLRHVAAWHDSFEDYSYSNFLAIHSRLTPWFGFGERKLPDLAAIVAERRIQVRGVVHVGAHLGEEIDLYRRLGAARMVMVEANPEVYAGLVARHGGSGDVVLVNRAAADRSEVRKLQLTSSSQSGSLLRLAKHAEIYPQIVASGEVEVQCTPLDDIMVESGQAGRDYNILNIDVQGAELMVLQGAERTLPGIDLINVEVNFAELYAGCPQIDDIDDFLAERGFRRAALACPYHPTWGDAVYVRTRTPAGADPRLATVNPE